MTLQPIATWISMKLSSSGAWGHTDPGPSWRRQLLPVGQAGGGVRCESGFQAPLACSLLPCSPQAPWKQQSGSGPGNRPPAPEQVSSNSNPFLLPKAGEASALARRHGRHFVNNEHCVMSPLQTLCFLVILGDKNPWQNNSVPIPSAQQHSPANVLRNFMKATGSFGSLVAAESGLPLFPREHSVNWDLQSEDATLVCRSLRSCVVWL